MQRPSIIFIQVKDNTSKLNKICSTVQYHFNLKERILLTVPSTEAALYIDQLLWRLPEESFLPHVVSQTPCQEGVVITTSTANLNQAHILFNLTPEIAPIASEFSKVYEWLDLTHPEKEALSRKRQAAYQSQGFSLILI